MKTFEERRRIKRFFYSKPVLLLLVIFVAVLLRAIWYGYQGSMIARGNLRVADLEKKELEARVYNISEDLEDLNTKRGMEEAVRSKFGVVKEGEEAIILVDPDLSKRQGETEKIGFWSKVKGFLGLE